MFVYKVEYEMYQGSERDTGYETLCARSYEGVVEYIKKYLVDQDEDRTFTDIKSLERLTHASIHAEDIVEEAFENFHWMYLNVYELKVGNYVYHVLARQPEGALAHVRGIRKETVISHPGIDSVIKQHKHVYGDWKELLEKENV